MRSSVDLPAPFGPTTPIRAPGGTVCERPSRTAADPYSFVMSRATSVAPRMPKPPDRKDEKTGYRSRGDASGEPRGSKRILATMAAAYGRPEEENIEVA